MSVIQVSQIWGYDPIYSWVRTESQQILLSGFPELHYSMDLKSIIQLI